MGGSCCDYISSKKVSNPKCEGKKVDECFDLINTKIMKKREACADCKGCCDYVSTKIHLVDSPQCQCRLQTCCDERHITLRMNPSCTECKGSCCDYMETSNANATQSNMINYL